MTKGLPTNRQLYGIIRQRPGGGRVLRLTTQNAPDVSGADGALIWRGEIMAGAELDIDLLAEPSAVTLGTLTLTQKATVALVAGVRRLTITTPAAWKVDASQVLTIAPTAILTGYAVHDVVATKANEVSVALTCPALAVGASFTLPAKLIRFT
ncbi:hypothetical protein KZ810_07940 [Sphingomonas sp. RHCKR47]|uniref:hypothetical protein n=1 Tax=Sphingomonas citricola TaxID=2862498 RepID=UPI001CA5220A|nr:hypothetical protein [Sphingomonas citricola]MBW6523427.1 hypothetical protein [Sphingomonas citricola]